MKLKKILFICLIAVLVFSLSGCSLNFFSVESLLSPPKQPGEIGEVQQAFNEQIEGASVQLKTPVSGEYQKSVILFDVDGDKTNEALVFYSDASVVEGAVRLAVMEYKSRKWKITADVKGAGNGVYDVSFADINKDGICEVFVNWSLIDVGSSKILSIYELKKSEEPTTVKSLASEYCDAISFVDFNKDKCKDLVLVYLDDTGTVPKTYLRLFSINENSELIKHSEIILDSSISTVSSIVSDVVYKGTKNETVRIFIDCLRADRQMFTELVTWNVRLSVPQRIYFDAASGNLRGNGICCYDIDSDGLYEVPVSSKLYGNEDSFKLIKQDTQYSLSLIKWQNTIGDSHSNKDIFTLYNSMDDYFIKFPWGNKVTVYYDSFREALLFCRWDEKRKVRGDELFSVYYRAEKADNEILGEKFAEDENGVYYYKITDAGYSFGLTDEGILSSFINIT